MKILSYIPRVFKHLMNRRTAVLLLIVLVILGLWYHVRATRNAFDDAYLTYAELAQRGDTAAYVPGVQDNPIRQQLNSVLTEVLADTVSPTQRLGRAQEGLLLLAESEQQINSIGELSDQITVALARMDLAAKNASDLTKKGTMRRIVSLAKDRLQIVQDIRGLSYRANFETEKIFTRIIEDGGSLTSSHITELNRQVPEVEAQFNRRSNLYRDLETVYRELSESYASL